MPFLGTIVNFFTVLICGILGTLIKKGVPKKIGDAIMSGMAVCVIYIAIDGMLERAPEVISEGALFSDGLVKIIVMILSIALGTLIGELIDIDKWIGKLGDFLQEKVTSNGLLKMKNQPVSDSSLEVKSNTFSKGFVSCSLLFCVGAMTVNGAIADAMGQPDILIAKSVIDGIACFVMATTLGIGCAFSAFFVLLYQGLISLVGLGLVAVLPEVSIAYMSATGSLVILLVGTNVLGCTNIKTANMIPAIFMPAIIWPILSLIL